MATTATAARTTTSNAEYRPRLCCTWAEEAPAAYPEEEDGGAPQDPARRVEGQESGVGHPRGAGQCRHDGPEERHPAADEDRAPTAPGQERPSLVQALAAL